MPRYICSMCQKTVEADSAEELVDKVRDHFKQEHEQRIGEGEIRGDIER